MRLTIQRVDECTSVPTVFWLVIAALTLVTAEGRAGYVRSAAGSQNWSIGNGLVEREVRFEPASGLFTSKIVLKVTGADFIRAAAGQNWGGPEFSFTVDGRPIVGSGRENSFDLLNASTQDTLPLGTSLTIRLKAKSLPLQVNVHYAVYDGHPALRKWIELRNVGSSAITVSHLVFEELNLAAGPPADLQVSGFYGMQPREILFTGRSEDAAILERNSRTGAGFVVMNEAPGYTKRTEVMNDWFPGVRVMYDTDLFPFERTIAPQESFVSAASSVAFFAEGQIMADVRWVMPSYTTAVLARTGSRYLPPWIYNIWEPFERTLDENIVLQSIPAAARMGMDVFTLDDGWQAEYGVNTVDATRLPHGLDPIREEVERRGMRLGLWVPLAAISTKTAAYKEHPGWQCQDVDGKPKFTDTEAGTQALFCLASPYREVAARRISSLISRYNLAYVKVDLTTVFSAYGEAPGCYARGHDHGTWAESIGRIYEGIQYVADRIHHDHPGVLVDLSFELWGQKHIIDYGLLSAGDLDWVSNVDDSTPESAGPRQMRTLLYHRSLAVPTDTMLVGSLRADASSAEERFATAIGSGPLFVGDLRKLTPLQLEWYGEKIRWFKDLRKRVPLNEGFFPLGAWEQPGATTWDGFARLSRQGEGIIVIFKNDSSVQRIQVRLPVSPDRIYSLRSVLTRSRTTISGSQLRHGVALSLKAGHKVEILEVR